LGSRVSGFRVPGFQGFRVGVSGYRVSGSGFRVSRTVSLSTGQGSGFRVSRLGFRFSGFQVSGQVSFRGFEVSGLEFQGFGVSGFRSRVSGGLSSRKRTVSLTASIGGALGTPTCARRENLRTTTSQKMCCGTEAGSHRLVYHSA